MSKTVKTAGAFGLVLTLLSLGIPAFFLNADQYQALAGGMQALGVALALLAAAITLTLDRTDRRVDRVLQLQEEFFNSELIRARRRLIDHLRKTSEDHWIRRVQLDELANDPKLNRYEGVDAQFNPRDDARRLLRFFQKANAARRGGVVDIPLFHELIGRPATWEAMALGKPPLGPEVVALVELADWANDYARNSRHSTVVPRYIEHWGESRKADFGETFRTPEDAENFFKSPSSQTVLRRRSSTRRDRS